MDIIARFVIVFSIMFLLTRLLTRKMDSRLSNLQLLLAFSAKVAMGLFYGFIFFKFYGGDDTWQINADSIAELAKLRDRPADFFEDLNLFRIIHEMGTIAGLEHWRMKIELALITKPLAIFNLFSRGNYYINIIAFSSITFWGHYWLYRLCREKWPGNEKWLFALVFLYPPTLFWLSGLRGDGLLFFFTSLCLLQFYYWLDSRTTRNLFFFLVGLAGVVFTRTPSAFIMIPVLLSWWLVKSKHTPLVKTFLLVHGVAIAVFFGTGLLSMPFSLPLAVVTKQADYFLLPGKTRVPIDQLKPGIFSFLKILPQALDNAFLRPYPWQAKGLLQWMTVLQNFILLFAAVLFYLQRTLLRQQVSGNTLAMGMLVFSLGACLAIGYTIPFPGALIRYRAIPELFLLTWLGLGLINDRITHYK